MKPTKCPLARFDEEGLEKDKRILREEKSECFLPALAIKKGYFSDETGRLHTHACFLCPAMYDDGGDYINCDFFSKWWWFQYGFGKKIKKKYSVKTKKKLIPDFPISDSSIPLTLSNTKDKKSVIDNWSKFRLKSP